MSVERPVPSMGHRILIRLGHRARTNVLGLVVSLLSLCLAVGLGMFALNRSSVIEQRTDRADQFMQALRDHDTDEMVTAMSRGFRERLAVQSGAGVNSTLARRTLEQVTQQSKVAGYREISSAPLKQGGSVHLFIATIKDGNGVESEVPYTVTVAGDGFVDKVE